MTLYAQRLTWLVIAALTVVLTLTLFSDVTERAEAGPSSNGVAASGGAAGGDGGGGGGWDYPPGRKRK